VAAVRRCAVNEALNDDGSLRDSPWRRGIGDDYIANVFNRQQWNPPHLNPTSTQFGQVTTVALNQMRFFTFGVRTTFSCDRLAT
jgi:transglutaminase-like putative cysteine protease